MLVFLRGLAVPSLADMDEPGLSEAAEYLSLAFWAKSDGIYLVGSIDRVLARPGDVLTIVKVAPNGGIERKDFFLTKEYLNGDVIP